MLSKGTPPRNLLTQISTLLKGGIIYLTDKHVSCESGGDRPSFSEPDARLLPAAESLAREIERIGGTPWASLDESGKHFYLACVEVVAIHLRRAGLMTHASSGVA